MVGWDNRGDNVAARRLSRKAISYNNPNDPSVNFRIGYYMGGSGSTFYITPYGEQRVYATLYANVFFEGGGGKGDILVVSDRTNVKTKNCLCGIFNVDIEILDLDIVTSPAPDFKGINFIKFKIRVERN